VGGDAADQEILWIVGDHRQELQEIADSKKMMVAIAYGMPFELSQFGLFHVSLHIDATSDTNKEGRPFVTVTSKDTYGKTIYSMCFFLVNRPGPTSGFFKLFFLS
jgi:hypothetical protein